MSCFLGPPTKTKALATGPLAAYLTPQQYRIGLRGRWAEDVGGVEEYLQDPNAAVTTLQSITVTAAEANQAHADANDPAYQTTHLKDARIIIAPLVGQNSTFQAYTTFIGSPDSMHLGRNADLIKDVDCRFVWVDKGFNLRNVSGQETFQNILSNPEGDELSRHDPLCKMKKSLVVEEAKKKRQHIPEWTVQEAPSLKEAGPYDRNKIIFTPQLASESHLHHGPTFIGTPGEVKFESN